MSTSLVYFPITLAPNNDPMMIEEAKKIVLALKPHWRNENGTDGLEYQFLTGGITNAILSIWSKTVGGPNDRVLLRIYGEKTELLIDRNAENKNMQLLNRYGCAAPLYGTFENGVIYGFIPGRVLHVEDVRDPHLSELIAKQMAKFHTVGLDDTQVILNSVDGKVISREPIMLPKIISYIEQLPEHFDNMEKQQKFENQFPSKSELQKELQLIREKIAEMQSPIVFCHNDLLIKNLIYDEKKDAIEFIDYEYAGFNYQAFDIGDHFAEYAGVDSIDFSLYPDEAYQKKWLRNYLKYWREFSNEPPPTDRDVNKLYIQVNVFAPLAHFWWSIWAIIQARYSSIDFDFLQYGIDRMNEYKHLKSKAWHWTIDQ